MNKKINTILFLLGATVFNVLITVLSCLLLGFICVKFPFLPDVLQGWYVPIIFIPSIAVSFIVYRTLLRFLMQKIELEKYFDPIFAGGQKKN